MTHHEAGEYADQAERSRTNMNRSAGYNILAKYYDAFQNAADQQETVDFILRACDRYLIGGRAEEHLRLADLGCGTGQLAVSLAAHGMQVSAVDVSAAMLGELEKKVRHLPEAARSRVQSIRGDITTHQFGARQDVLIAMTDSLNHVPSEAMQRLFQTAARNVRAGGLFIFDLLTESFLATERGTETFFAELGPDPDKPEAAMVWTNCWQPETATAVSDLTFFERQPGRTDYRRRTEQIIEYYHDLKTIDYLWHGAFECVHMRDLEDRRLFVLRRV